MFHIHGFFITINSMILYFKHIMHIDDFRLNGHPPSWQLWECANRCIPASTLFKVLLETNKPVMNATLEDMTKTVNIRGSVRSNVCFAVDFDVMGWTENYPGS